MQSPSFSNSRGVLNCIQPPFFWERCANRAARPVPLSCVESLARATIGVYGQDCPTQGNPSLTLVVKHGRMWRFSGGACQSWRIETFRRLSHSYVVSMRPRAWKTTAGISSGNYADSFLPNEARTMTSTSNEAGSGPSLTAPRRPELILIESWWVLFAKTPRSGISRITATISGGRSQTSQPDNSFIVPPLTTSGTAWWRRSSWRSRYFQHSGAE